MTTPQERSDEANKRQSRLPHRVVASSPRGSIATYRRAPHVAAVITACALFPLLFVGAGVTSKGAGMAFPDWPTSSGHLVNPPNWWQADHTRWEHGHRLLGWTVGMLAIVSAVLCWPSGGLVRNVAIGCLAAIIVQGVLGGIRVVQNSATLAMIHGIWGQVTFSVACSVSAVTSRTWNDPRRAAALPAARFLQRLCLVAVTALLVQTALGAGVRHFDCPYSLVTHLLLAVLLAMLLGWIAMWLIGSFPRNQLLGLFGRILAVLTAVQLFVGGMTFLVSKMAVSSSPVVLWAVPSAHVAIGALLLAGSLLTTLAAYRMLQPVGTAPETIPAGTVPTS